MSDSSEESVYAVKSGGLRADEDKVRASNVPLLRDGGGGVSAGVAKALFGLLDLIAKGPSCT